jgi:archaemetzincin
MEIDLQPIGEIEDEILHQLTDRLHKTFGCPIVIRDPIAVPEEAFSPSRKQYLSDTFLQALKLQKKPLAYTLGITEFNLYTHGLNFVFGQADVEGGVSVISLYLLRQENYGVPADSNLLIERAEKEAVHELGHNLGMGHCTDGSCVMHFSNSLIDTDVKKPHFCGRCRPKLAL